MGIKDFARTLAREYKSDDLSNVAGAVTFFGILAIFPFLLFLVSLASLFIDPNTADTLVASLSRIAPRDATNILSERIHSLGSHPSVGLLTLGGLGALWAASGGIVALIDALNKVYDVQERRPFWKVRGLALLTTIFAAVLAIAAMLLAVAAPAAARALGGPLGQAIRWLRIPAAGGLMMFVWAVLYWGLPDVEHRFRLISPGSIAGVTVWMVASWGFSSYVSHFGSYEATYGALGGVIVMLVWMWISAQVILLGAEINAILERQGPRAGAEAHPSAARTPGSGAPDRRGGERPRASPEGLSSPDTADGRARVSPRSLLRGVIAFFHAPTRLVHGRRGSG
jgi:membrane protein